MSDLNRAIDQLAAADLRFHVAVPWAYGQKEFFLSTEEAKAFMVDAPAVLAAQCGVPREAYLGFHRDNFTAHCCATTREGKPCRNSVPGGATLGSPKEWLNLQGQYCTTHGR
jgi:hypothetical protein